MSDRNRNDFDFDDDFFGGDDDNAPLPGDDEFTPDFGDTGEDLPVIESTEQRGTNRTFIILAAVMIVLFLIGLGAVLFLALRDTGPSPAEQTATAISATNVVIAELANQTATQSALFEFETQTRAAITDTPSPSPSPTPTATNTPEPTLDPTSIAATQNIVASQTALALAGIAAQETATALSNLATLNAQATENALATAAAQTQQAQTTDVGQVPTQEAGIDPINQTATAIAGRFLTLTAQAANAGGGAGAATPTQEGAGFGTPIARPTALPETGLFDEVVGGGREGIGLLALAVVGLVGVIVISRNLRSRGTAEEPEPDKTI